MAFTLSTRWVQKPGNPIDMHQKALWPKSNGLLHRQKGQKGQKVWLTNLAPEEKNLGRVFVLSFILFSPPVKPQSSKNWVEKEKEEKNEDEFSSFV